MAGGGRGATALPLRVTGYPPVADRREAVAGVVRGIAPPMTVSLFYGVRPFHLQFPRFINHKSLPGLAFGARNGRRS